MALTVIAAYDVSNDQRRSHLAALLQTWGDRVQLSVFVLTVGEDDLVDIRARAQTIMDPDEDSLYLFRQCAPCWDGIDCIGQAMPPTQDLFWAAL